VIYKALSLSGYTIWDEQPYQLRRTYAQRRYQKETRTRRPKGDYTGPHRRSRAGGQLDNESAYRKIEGALSSMTNFLYTKDDTLLSRVPQQSSSSVGAYKY
jgi:hypothetical protein